MGNSRKLLVGFLFAFILLTGCQAAQEQATPTPIPTPIVAEKPTYTVQRGTVERYMTFNARVSPVQEVELYFRMNGFVKTVFKERNDSVLEGEIIAELEMESLLNSLAQAQVSLEQAQLALEAAKQQNERDLAQSAINLEMKELRLQKAKEQNPHLNVVIAKARLEEAQAAVQLAQANYDKVAWQPGVEATGAARALQSATIALEIAKANYESAVQAEEAYKYDIALLEKELELARLQHSWLERGVDENKVKAVQQAELNVQRLRDQIATGQLVSPINGVLTSISIIKGRQVEAFKPVAVVANREDVHITAQLSDAEMTELKEGMPVTVTLATLGMPVSGKITKLPYPFGTGGTRDKLEKADPYTYIELDDASIKLSAGDTVRVSILLERSENTLYLPPAAVRSFEGRNFVVVQDEGRQRRIDIKVGVKGEDRIEILEGIEEGQVVISQ